MRHIARTLILVPLILLFAAPASAATGDLSFKGCLAKFVVAPCSAVPSEVLDGGRDVAVSPDGKLIFVADAQDSVVGFKRSLADGSITYASCVDNNSEPGCTHLSPIVLGPPRSLAFSPDGASLYVLTETTDVVLRFTVGTGGTLTFAGCAEDAALPESNCATEVPGLENMLRVVVSPDGASVYASGEEGAIAHFNAALQLQGCYREVTVIGCGVQAEPLSAPYGMAVSPDGKHLYATSVGHDAIAWFTLGANGALTSVECLSDDDDATAFSDSCAEESGVDYNRPSHIVFSVNGDHAYVIDETSLGAVYHFTRDALTGALTRQDCLADDLNVDAPGCTELDDSTGSGLNTVMDAAISPDSANLYTVATADTALSTFGLSSPAGALTHIRCLRANDVVVQGCAPFNSSALGGPFGVAVSPDGHDLYVANGNGVPALLHFEREAPGTRPGEDPGGEDPGGEGPGSTPGPTPGPGPGPAPIPPPDPPTVPNVKCGGLRATIVGTDRADTLRGTAKADVIAARGGNDKVQGLGGKDTVCGEAGNDNLAGGAKADALLGGPGKDTLLGGPGADRLVGGPGRDTAKQ